MLRCNIICLSKPAIIDCVAPCSKFYFHCFPNRKVCWEGPVSYPVNHTHYSEHNCVIVKSSLKMDVFPEISIKVFLRASMHIKGLAYASPNAAMMLVVK